MRTGKKLYVLFSKDKILNENIFWQCVTTFLCTGGSAPQGVLCAASHKATDHKILKCLVVDEITHSCSQWLCAVNSRRAGALHVLNSAPIQISIDSEPKCIMFHLWHFHCISPLFKNKPLHRSMSVRSKSYQTRHMVNLAIIEALKRAWRGL